jgi:hypothetical protein
MTKLETKGRLIRKLGVISLCGGLIAMFFAGIYDKPLAYFFAIPSVITGGMILSVYKLKSNKDSQ